MNFIKLTVSVLLLSACQTQLASQQDAILGGQLVVDSQDFPTVVALVNNFGGLCTCTLIAPRVVLTAAHCVDPVVLGVDSEEQVAQATHVVLDSTDAFAPFSDDGEGRVIGATKTVMHPAFSLN